MTLAFMNPKREKVAEEDDRVLYGICSAEIKKNNEHQKSIQRRTLCMLIISSITDINFDIFSPPPLNSEETARWRIAFDVGSINTAHRESSTGKERAKVVHEWGGDQWEEAYDADADVVEEEAAFFLARGAGRGVELRPSNLIASACLRKPSPLKQQRLTILSFYPETIPAAMSLQNR